MKNRRAEHSWLRRLGIGTAALGVILAAMSFAATPASAEGNNGTVKVDEQALDHGPGGENGPGAPNSNDPHIACAGRVEWYGFDPGAQSADVLFEVWAPTSQTADPADAVAEKSYNDVAIADGDGPGGVSLDGFLNFDLSDILANFTPQEQQGYHVKVTVNTSFTDGSSDVKHKVFWVDECEAPQCVPTTQNNQCTPCPTGTPDGQGGCTQPQCVPTTENNQCTTCPTGSTPNGLGGCTTTTQTPVDECPDQEGFQDNPDQCLQVLPDVIEPEPEPPAEPPTEVQGVVIARPAELPRTGATTVPLLAVGLSLILVGAGALFLGRERPALS